MKRIQSIKRVWCRFRNPLLSRSREWWFEWLRAAVPTSELDCIELLCASSAIMTFRGEQ